jgi:hypothetical protein
LKVSKWILRLNVSELNNKKEKTNKQIMMLSECCRALRKRHIGAGPNLMALHTVASVIVRLLRCSSFLDLSDYNIGKQSRTPSLMLEGCVGFVS